MWALNFLPDIIFHLIFVLGIIGILIGFLLGFVPFVSRYRYPIQIISIVLFSIGLWYEGGIAKDKEWKQKIAVIEAELEKAKAQSAVITTEVVTKYITKTNVIREKGKVITEYIDREITVYDESCEIPQVAIKVHDAAAKNDPELLKNLSLDKVIDIKDHDDAAKNTLKLAPKK